MAAGDRQGHVAILMGLYNGGPWIDAQLASFAAQDHRDWSLVVGDDGSRDDGPQRIAAFAKANPHTDVTITPGPQRGFACNFLSLIALTADMPLATLALSDQDDVWHSHRLARGLAALTRAGAGPMLYCARTMVCDEGLRPLHPSPLWGRPFSFANALVQNVASGNTIMLNPAMAALARAAAPAAMRAGIVAHDWWLYQLATACGALVVQDEEPVLSYRQHTANSMGRNDTVGAKAKRVRQLLDGTFARWTDANRRALLDADVSFGPAPTALLHQFEGLRSARVTQRLAALRQLGLYRQSAGGDRALWLSATLGTL